MDAIVAPLGGGGLLSGIAAAVRALKPATRIYAAEPETAAPLSASLAAGHPVYFDHWQASFVDGAGGKSVLPTMWPLLSSLSGSLVVSLADVALAMKLVAERTHIIAEGRRRLRDRRGAQWTGIVSGAARRWRQGGRRRLRREHRPRKIRRARRRM